MKITQIDKLKIEVTENIDTKKTRKLYIRIDSEEGQKLIKEYNLVINPEIEEF